jgi:hypothetical protein
MWDGVNKLQGELILDTTAIKFRLIDFSKSDLQMNLPLSDIDTVSYESVYGLNLKALKIISIEGRSNIFVIENPEKYLTLIHALKNT